MHVSGYPLSSGFDLMVTEDFNNQQLGQVTKSPDGRRFRAVKAGAVALVVGHLLQSPAANPNYSNLSVAADVFASITGAGPTTITITNGASAITADQFAGGLMEINAGSGIGQTFTILTNSVAAPAGLITLSVEEAVSVDLLAISSKAVLRVNAYNGVISHPIVATGTPVGVAITAIAAGEYGWIQEGGEVATLSDATPALIGQGVMPSTVTAGAVTVLAAGAVASIGRAAVAGVSAEMRGVNLSL